MLTGNPRINGILIPQPQYEGYGDGRFAWNADHLWFDGREGRILRSLRFKGEITFGWQNLETAAFNKIVAALALETPVRFVPATRRRGDPAGAEESVYECELTSPLPVYGAGDVATGAHSLSVTLKATRTRESRDGIGEDALDYAFDFDAGVDLFGGTVGPPYTTSVSGYEGKLLKAETDTPQTGTLRFLDAAGNEIRSRQIETGDSPAYEEVPVGAREVSYETEGSERLRLTFDDDGFALTLVSETADTQTIAAQGRANFQDGSYDLTFMTTRTFETTKITPEGTASRYVEDTEGGRARIILDS